MKSTILVLITAFLVFIATENYMLSNMEITGTTGSYTVSVFGGEFEYK